jgi:hypothetical protein
MSIGIRLERAGSLPADRLGGYFFDHARNDPALVLAALRAGTMRKLLFVAVRARARVHGRKKVMAAALGGALFRVTPFRIGHCNFPSNSDRRGVSVFQMTCKARQRIPTWIGHGLGAVAACKI